MSLLTTGIASVSANIALEKEIVQRVTSVVQAPMNILQTMYYTWSKAFLDLWGNPDITPILLEKIGTQGAELLNLNNILVDFMRSQLTGVRDDIVHDINQKLELIPPFNFHPDGTMYLTLSTPSLSS